MDTNYSLADIAAATGGNRNNDGFGDGNGWWIILFLLICGWGGYGFGGGYNGGGTNTPGFQGFATRSDIDAALATQGIESGITGIGTQLCNGFAGVNSAIANLGYQNQQCCCDLKQAIGDVNYNMAAQTNILQNTVNNGFRDVIEAQNAGTQRIIDTITQDKIQSLQTELQSAQLQLSNQAQTTNIINALRPTPTPSYPVMSPYTSIINPTGFTFGVNGCGCNTGCGCC
jgi:hypothetical protein